MFIIIPLLTFFYLNFDYNLNNFDFRLPYCILSAYCFQIINAYFRFFHGRSLGNGIFFDFDNYVFRSAFLSGFKYFFKIRNTASARTEEKFIIGRIIFHIFKSLRKFLAHKILKMQHYFKFFSSVLLLFFTYGILVLKQKNS